MKVSGWPDTADDCFHDFKNKKAVQSYTGLGINSNKN